MYKIESFIVPATLEYTSYSLYRFISYKINVVEYISFTFCTIHFVCMPKVPKTLNPKCYVQSKNRSVHKAKRLDGLSRGIRPFMSQKLKTLKEFKKLKA